ncbi:hypothetical protein D3C71_1899860 [compost metagenome]
MDQLAAPGLCLFTPLPSPGILLGLGLQTTSNLCQHLLKLVAELFDPRASFLLLLQVVRGELGG